MNAAVLQFPPRELTQAQIERINSIAVEAALKIVDDGIARLIPAILDDIQIRRFEDVLAMEYPAEVPFT